MWFHVLDMTKPMVDSPHPLTGESFRLTINYSSGRLLKCLSVADDKLTEPISIVWYPYEVLLLEIKYRAREFLFDELNGIANGKAENWVKLDWERIRRHGKISLLEIVAFNG
jgi:hypothetical protein